MSIVRACKINEAFWNKYDTLTNLTVVLHTDMKLTSVKANQMNDCFTISEWMGKLGFDTHICKTNKAPYYRKLCFKALK